MNSDVNDNGVHSPETRVEVEDRLNRLEKAIAAMQDTKLMEERLLERVMSRMDQAPPVTPPPPVASIAPPEAADDRHSILNAGMAILPGALRAVSNEFNHATDPRSAPPPTTGTAPSRVWLFTDLVLEIRTMWVMFVDHRFRTTWTARIVPLICLIIAVMDAVMLGGIFGGIVERLMLIVLTIVAYKTLSREAARYRAETGYLNPRPYT